VLGSDLDALEAQTFTIAEDVDSFELLAVADGNALERSYPRALLQERAEQMVAGRGPEVIS